MTPPKPETHAAVLVSHGDRGGASPNAALIAQASVVSEITKFEIYPGVLKGDPSLEDTLARAASSGASRLAIYPLFMADGYFVRKVRERVAAFGLATEPLFLAPLGLDPGLPAIVIQEALKAAAATDFDPTHSRLLIVGHGSKLGPASANATRTLAARVALGRKFASVTSAFLEEEPFVEDALRSNRGNPTVVAGFFFGDGMHAGEDVPEAIRETGAIAAYTGALGTSLAIAPLIAAALTNVA